MKLYAVAYGAGNTLFAIKTMIPIEASGKKPAALVEVD